MRWPYLNVRTAPIDERDVAAVVTYALCKDGYVAAEYFLTGPQSLTQLEQVSTIGQVIGNRYKSRRCPQIKRGTICAR